MKIKLFTHNDLDGVSCGVLAKLAFGDNADISYCNYDKINEEVSQFLNEGQYQLFDQVFITDISVNELVANKINELVEEEKLNIQLLDHHPTAEWLNKYEWATVKPTELAYVTAGDTIDKLHMVEDIQKTSGTSMFLDYLDGMGDLSLSIKLNDFVELVRQYDTWEWSTKYNNQHAKQLNDLLYIIGRDRFVERFVEDIDPVFYEYEQLLLEIEQEKINRYIESKAKQLQEYKIGEYKAGVVFAEQYQSQLGNELSKLNPELDFIAIINMANMTVSYRTIREDINVGLIAKMYGGGGHPKAAGSQFDPVAQTSALNVVFPW